LEDLVIDGLESSELFIWATRFRHVVFRGVIGNIKIQPVWPVPNQALDRVWLSANQQFYQKVDWALDIREAEFDDFEVRGVPCHLIRMDPETQCVIPRKIALNTDFSRIGFDDPLFCRVIEMGLVSTEPFDFVIVAGKRSRHFKMKLRGIRRLRELGLAK
jgi:hypothetical protein